MTTRHDTTTNCEEIARDTAQRLAEYFTARANYRDTYGAADTAQALAYDEPAGHPRHTDAADTLAELAAAVAAITGETANLETVEDAPTPDDIDDRDPWEDLGALTVEQYAHRSSSDEDWRLHHIEIVLTVGGPHIEIVADENGARVDAYWSGDKGTRRITCDHTHAAIEQLFNDLEQGY